VTHGQQRKLLDLQQIGIRVGQLLGWIVLFLALLGLFPTTRALQPLLFSILHIPAQLITIGLLAYGVVRLGGMVIERVFLALEEGANWAPERSQRLSLRFSTFLQVTQSIFALTVVVIAVVATLALWGIQVGPLLAGAGIVGLAISLASQSLIKDFINGFLILLEDQFGLGDFIMVDNVQGMVENLNLRVTQLRDAEGGLITIPNGQIAVVRNLSKEWSRVDLQLTVDPSTDANHAMSLLSLVAEAMSQDPQWQAAILEPPNMLGVDNLNHLGMTLRLWVKTAPLQQWAVARELRRRVKQTFDQAGIAIAIPQQRLQVDPAQWHNLAQELPETGPAPASGPPPEAI
jgi:small conductance mechanosensitive channel